MPDFLYKISIPWRKGDTINSWDQICADCVEQFGLPGNKYKTTVSAESMEFYFKESSDALWFSLRVE